MQDCEVRNMERIILKMGFHLTVSNQDKMCKKSLKHCFLNQLIVMV